MEVSGAYASPPDPGEVVCVCVFCTVQLRYPSLIYGSCGTFWMMLGWESWDRDWLWLKSCWAAGASWCPGGSGWCSARGCWWSLGDSGTSLPSTVIRISKSWLAHETGAVFIFLYFPPSGSLKLCLQLLLLLCDSWFTNHVLLQK